eukprot:9030362-Lingulodinium_polyedra.AAC.1
MVCQAHGIKQTFRLNAGIVAAKPQRGFSEGLHFLGWPLAPRWSLPGSQEISAAPLPRVHATQ